jgi:hypothetical protein
MSSDHEHPFRYSWLQYLPHDNIADEFWSALRPCIIMHLKRMKVLHSMNGTPQPPEKLRLLTAEHLDRHGEPLLEDLHDGIYLSQRYAQSDHAQIHALGTSKMSLADFLDLAEAKASTNMPWVSRDQDWHERFSTLLLQCLKATPDLQLRVERLSVLPRTSGWGKAYLRPTYLPLSDDQEPPIPRDLGISTLQMVETGPKRRELFRRLGVKNCPVQEVVRAITDKYQRSASVDIGPEASKLHVQFLFHRLPLHQLTPDRSIFLLDRDGNPAYRRPSSNLYFGHTSDEHHAAKLFAADANAKAPAFEAKYLHSIYLCNEHPNHSNGNLSKDYSRRMDIGCSFEQWLETHMGVSYLPVLLEPGGLWLSLSAEFRYLIRDKPTKFVSLLRNFPESYETDLAKLGQYLPNVEIRTTGGVRKLSETFLPLPEMVSIVSEMGLKNFPFLEVQDDCKSASHGDWRLLGTLHVGLKKDVAFYLEALDCIYRTVTSSAVEHGFDVVSAASAAYSGILRFHEPRDWQKIRYIAFVNCYP